MEILESEGKEAAEEYKSAERNKVCANIIRYVVSRANSSDPRSCQSARSAEKTDQKLIQIAAKSTWYKYDGSWRRRADKYQAKCKDDRARIASSIMQVPGLGFNGPKCLQLQEAGEIKQPHPNYESYIKQGIADLGITAQSYCENSKFGCD
jgi:hypothetical protein